MKRIVAAAVLAASWATLAQGEEIDVTDGEDNARWTVDADSLEWRTISDGERVVTAKTYVYDDDGRRWAYALVLGCGTGYGTITVGDNVENAKTLHWRKDGSRVYDGVAEAMCALDGKGRARDANSNQ